MKSALFFTALLSSTIFAQEQPRYETKSRILSESVVKVSHCSNLNTSSYEGSTHAQVFNTTTREYEYKLVPETNINTSSSYEVVKCQRIENYQVGVTGSYLKWNRKESEVAGSSKVFYRLVSQTKQVKDSISFSQSNSTSGAIIVLDLGVNILAIKGLEAKVKEQCLADSSNMRNMQVNIRNTECRE